MLTPALGAFCYRYTFLKHVLYSRHCSHYWTDSMHYCWLHLAQVHLGEKHLKIITRVKYRRVHVSARPWSRAPHSIWGGQKWPGTFLFSHLLHIQGWLLHLCSWFKLIPPRLGPCKQSLLFIFLSVFLNVSFLYFSVLKTKHDHYHLTNQRWPVTGHSTTSYSFCLLQDRASLCFRIQWRDLLLFIPLSFPHVQFEFCLDRWPETDLSKVRNDSQRL